VTWLSALNDGYEARVDSASNFAPVYHTWRSAHVLISLNEHGTVMGIDQIPVDRRSVIIPTTEDATNRTSDSAPHLLHDNIDYLASDYGDYFPKDRKRAEQRAAAHREQLKDFCSYEGLHDATAKTVLDYLETNIIMEDLIKYGLLTSEDDTSRWVIEKLNGTPLVYFNVLSDKSSVETFQAEWIHYYQEVVAAKSIHGVCYATGHTNVPLAKKCLKGLRRGGDSGKLISYSDTVVSERFSHAEDMYSVGLEEQWKAFNFLRWAFDNYHCGYTDRESLVAVASRHPDVKLPAMDDDILDIVFGRSANLQDIDNTSKELDAIGQAFAKKMAGYSAKLSTTENVLLIGVDSLVPGRLALTYNHDMLGCRYLECINRWHATCRWWQRRDSVPFIGAPAPRVIASVVYGRQVDARCKARVVKQVTRAILGIEPLPRTLVDAAVRRVGNPDFFDNIFAWRQGLGVACALWSWYTANQAGKAAGKGEGMQLDRDNSDRCYLFGRLLAVADYAEERVKNAKGSKSPTYAFRSMQAFSQQPRLWWQRIYEHLTSYLLQCNGALGWIPVRVNKEISSIINTFSTLEDFNDEVLNGNYLIGYDLEMRSLWEKKSKDNTLDSAEDITNE